MILSARNFYDYDYFFVNNINSERNETWGPENVRHTERRQMKTGDRWRQETDGMWSKMSQQQVCQWIHRSHGRERATHWAGFLSHIRVKSHKVGVELSHLSALISSEPYPGQSQISQTKVLILGLTLTFGILLLRLGDNFKENKSNFEFLVIDWSLHDLPKNNQVTRKPRNTFTHDL